MDDILASDLCANTHWLTDLHTLRIARSICNIKVMERTKSYSTIIIALVQPHTENICSSSSSSRKLTIITSAPHAPDDLSPPSDTVHFCPSFRRSLQVWQMSVLFLRSLTKMQCSVGLCDLDSCPVETCVDWTLVIINPTRSVYFNVKWICVVGISTKNTLFSSRCDFFLHQAQRVQTGCNSFKSCIF